MPWPNFSSSQKRKRSSSGFNRYAYANYRRRINNERTPSSSSRSQPSTSSRSSQGSRKSHSSTSRTAQSSTPSQSFRSSQSSQPSQSTRVDEFGDDSVFDHIECIDLTGDTPSTSFVSSQSPSLQRAPQPRASQSLRVDEFGDESVFDDIVDQSQVSNERAFEQNILYGILPSKIVGVRYYNGNANIGEMVMNRREPSNAYDSNAIRVDNVHGAKIGHIPRQLAGKLAKYMDSRSLMVEGKITGLKGEFDCPMELRLYGTSDPIARAELVTQMRADRLPVNEFTKWEKIQKERFNQQVQTGEGSWGFGSSQGTPTQPIQTLDNIIGESQKFDPRKADQAVEKFGTKEADLEQMPMAPQPDTIKAELLPYQLQGLQWMLDHENPKPPAVGSTDVVQLWKRVPGKMHSFMNVCTNFSTDMPELASGGILADDMGLGKTVQVISLIMADRALYAGMEGVGHATLILAPLSVMSNWSTQIERHVKPEHQLRVLIYHGTRKKRIDPKEIANYDVVVTTYETASSEYWGGKANLQPKPVPRKDGLFSVTWRRLVLDEGHQIRTPTSKKAVAACNLDAQSRWALTGTPIINGLKDLFSLIKFLRLSGGLAQFELFNASLMRPVNQGQDSGNLLLQTLMQGICLRRRKDMPFIDLRLPELTQVNRPVELLPHEKEKYDLLEAQAQGTLSQYRAQSSVAGANAAQTYRHLFEILLRLRQVCNHWKLVGEERLAGLYDALEKNKTVELTPENYEALQRVLQISIDAEEECSICFDGLNDVTKATHTPVITCCAHVFGSDCIQKWIEMNHTCPLCRAKLPSVDTLVKPAEEAPAAAPSDIENAGRSSKVERLLEILQATRAKDKTIKTIVFSQWTSFLDIVQPELDAAGIKYARIDGSMTALARDASLNALDNDPDTTVLLASLACCSVGLNLVAASQVILSDTWWAPAIEDQAVDRVYRLGQTRPTTVFRLIVEGTIEDRVLGIQQDKRKLMALAFSEKSNQGRSKVGRAARMADLERLLGRTGTAGAAAGGNSEEATTTAVAGEIPGEATTSA
ncbi:SNF2 family N-terminal domain-containing protein [Phyllosticta capitalensis]|uniref:SNF2 family N-terminal domain-containing protein n=1 Tax=Phyllosticta capitalensis TaxID=121624 RepID=A0ABR1YBY6_9PEZI